MTLSTLALGLAVAFPLGVLASHQFGDVPDANPFHDDIEALADSGVTLGCGGGNYCPSQYVTREQMAAFLNRLGALADDQTPVVNAARVDGIDEVMPGGTIETYQVGPWVSGNGHPVTVIHTHGASTFGRDSAGIGVARLFLNLPGTFGGVQYTLQDLQVCYQADANVKIDSTTVMTTRTAAVNEGLIVDPTDRGETAGSCFTVDPNYATGLIGGVTLALNLDYTAAGIITLGNVTASWIPAAFPVE